MKVDPIAGIDPPAAVSFGQAVEGLLRSIRQSGGPVLIYTNGVLIIRGRDGSTCVVAVPPGEREDVLHRVNTGDWEGLLAMFWISVAA